MIIVIAELRIAAGSLDAAREAIAAMELASREEPGCHRYAFSQDISDPEMVRITELWESQADLQAHFQTPHMAVFGAALGQIDVQSMDVKAFELGEAVPMPV